MLSAAIRFIACNSGTFSTMVLPLAMFSTNALHKVSGRRGRGDKYKGRNWASVTCVRAQ